MAYSYTPSNTDATAVAARLASQANAITGTPALAAPIVAPAFQAFLDALADGLLDVLGYRAQNDQASPGGVYGGGPFANAPFVAWAVTVPVTKTYLLHVDTSCWMTVAADAVLYQITVDGAAPGGQPVNGMQFYFNALVQHQRVSFRLPLALTAGARSIALQWTTAGGGGTLNANANDCLLMTLTG